MDNITCPKCKSIPQTQYCNNNVFTTYHCYSRCGFIFWTLTQCLFCKEPNSTILLNKPKFGQKIKCNACHQEMFFFICNKSSCQQIFYKPAGTYVMGEMVTCQNQQCKNQFKNVTCTCGNLFYISKEELVYQGVTQFQCQCCMKKLIYTVCPTCKEPEYHLDKLNVGDRIRCSSCKVWRKYVPCPLCGRCLKGQEFSFFQPIHCQYCNKWFQFLKCAYNCSDVGYNKLTKRLGPQRQCYSCHQNYAVINCGKCKQSLFRQKLSPSTEAFIEICPICKGKLQYFYCPCGNFNNNSLHCSCGNKPKKVNDAIKQQQLQNKVKQEATQQQKQCKLCFSQQSNMINQLCGHIVMCQNCSKTFLNNQPNASKPCPICRTIGKYHKYKKPIYS